MLGLSADANSKAASVGGALRPFISIKQKCQRQQGEGYNAAGDDRNVKDDLSNPPAAHTVSQEYELESRDVSNVAARRNRQVTRVQPAWQRPSAASEF